MTLPAVVEEAAHAAELSARGAPAAARADVIASYRRSLGSVAGSLNDGIGNHLGVNFQFREGVPGEWTPDRITARVRTPEDALRIQQALERAGIRSEIITPQSGPGAGEPRIWIRPETLPMDGHRASLPHPERLRHALFEGSPAMRNRLAEINRELSARGLEMAADGRIMHVDSTGTLRSAQLNEAQLADLRRAGIPVDNIRAEGLGRDGTRIMSGPNPGERMIFHGTDHSRVNLGEVYANRRTMTIGNTDGVVTGYRRMTPDPHADVHLPGDPPGRLPHPHASGQQPHDGGPHARGGAPHPGVRVLKALTGRP